MRWDVVNVSAISVEDGAVYCEGDEWLEMWNGRVVDLFVVAVGCICGFGIGAMRRWWGGLDSEWLHAHEWKCELMGLTCLLWCVATWDMV